MNLIRRVFPGGSPMQVLSIGELPLPLNYTLSAFRWHMDSRPSSKAILVHDLFGSSASWQQLLNEDLSRLPLSQLSPTTPLELYAVELRGHNHSVGLPCPSDGDKYTLASAADVVLHQKQILRTDAKLVGLGFGALVACQAALHAPLSSFDSLTLFVNGPSQLHSCDPSHYHLPAILRGVPQDARSLGDLEQYLRKTVPNAVERALIFAAVEQRDGGLRFRFSEELLKLHGPFKGTANIAEDVTFGNPVTVVQCGMEAFPQEAKDRFLKHFPRATFLQFKGDRSAGIAGLYAQGSTFVYSFLESLGLLGKIEADEKEEV
ncbi:uncharacterized protein Tco025E_01151 [Trypanosoma conorhini]|uniref:AB hydrolase-1 domain-containing protein n=1 Tax=Trypanosoma conorhini TaxID=83891 RepID=A0A3R7PK62_9TRYP|nr:uncharacterized protein Tco025E_01151 [Trypanosoma conorhini]RNF26548.1 hypothetical protein Tco025E_01151 [Trypanosoma conorhini]